MQIRDKQRFVERGRLHTHGRQWQVPDHFVGHGVEMHGAEGEDVDDADRRNDGDHLKRVSEHVGTPKRRRRGLALRAASTPALPAPEIGYCSTADFDRRLV